MFYKRSPNNGLLCHVIAIPGCVFMPITISQVTKGSIVVYFGVDQQTDTSLEDVLARLEVRILLLIG